MITIILFCALFCGMFWGPGAAVTIFLSGSLIWGLLCLWGFFLHGLDTLGDDKNCCNCQYCKLLLRGGVSCSCHACKEKREKWEKFLEEYIDPEEWWEQEQERRSR